MKQIVFSGVLCLPEDVEKDGNFKIRGRLSSPKLVNHPPVYRYEQFATTRERDMRYTQIMRQLDPRSWS